MVLGKTDAAEAERGLWKCRAEAPSCATPGRSLLTRIVPHPSHLTRPLIKGGADKNTKTSNDQIVHNDLNKLITKYSQEKSVALRLYTSETIGKMMEFCNSDAREIDPIAIL